MQACTLGASCFNIIRLATKEYHIDMDGVASLTEEDIQACGYSRVKASMEDLVMCYSNINLVHRKASKLWYNSYAHTLGPHVDKILQKSLSLFPRLESSRVENAINFYDRLQEVSMGYIIALTPFNAIVLAHRHKGLCPPGLGLVKYAAMSKALMELLPRLIPDNLFPQISATLAWVHYKSKNGYDYMWHVFKLTVPGFDPTVPIHAPIWSDVEDIFHFAQAYLLYFCIQAKVKFHYNNHTRSGMFLCTVQFLEYADTVTTLLSHVNSFQQEYDKGYLPTHLRLQGLATSIHQNAQAQLREIISPRIRRTNGDFSQVQGLPRANRIGREDCPCGGFKDRGGNRPGAGYRDRGRDYNDHGQNARPLPSDGAPTRECGRAPRGPGLLACPNCNHRPLLPDV
jgi:hypothetical protein